MGYNILTNISKRLIQSVTMSANFCGVEPEKPYTFSPPRSNKMTVRRYSDEFKKNALDLFKTSGKKLSQLERELGIPHGLLRQWQAKFEIAVPSGKLVLNEVETLLAENKQLQRELEIVTMEREILKKTVGIFSSNR
jgi:transposase